MKKLIFVIVLILSFQITFASEYQSYIDLYERKIQRNQKEIDKLSNYTMKYGIVKDIQYFERLLEKYKYIQKREQARFEALSYFKKCKNTNENCNYLNYKSNATSVGEIQKLIAQNSNIKWDYEYKIEKLTKNINYLHKSKKEIELREQQEVNKNKFEAKKSKYIKQKKKKNVSENTKKENNLRNIFSKRLEKALKGYDKNNKIKVYTALLKALQSYDTTEEINILIEIIQQKL